MKAGRNIQDEITRKKYSTPASSRVYLYVTEGYNLNCKAVFHTVCTRSTDPKATQVGMIYFFFISN